ncbi:hypothetical protein ACTG16_22880 [Aeromonas sp. 23P]|uniref:hypothetical protein n=1 Tax=Aeromonas sp. 23P TaxID=3452716 RepID=UPI003F7A200A|nr:hypothetical protein [Aeromonas veronii]
MANHVVKLTSSEFGESHSSEWHLVSPILSEPATLCGGEYYGEGQSHAQFEEKIVPKGGVTCEECLRIIRFMKATKL